MKSNLIGLGLTILGGGLIALTNFLPLCVIPLIGVFLFASFPDEAVFVDYVIANNSNKALARKRYYLDFLPFTIVSQILTLGRAPLKIVWKEDYFTVQNDAPEESKVKKITRKEYIGLRNEQREIYSSQPLSLEFMKNSYSMEDIGFKRKKRRLIIVSIFAGLMLTGLTDPTGFPIVLVYEALFIPMILLWIPEYKDAKILQEAYNRALNTPSSE